MAVEREHAVVVGLDDQIKKEGEIDAGNVAVPLVEVGFVRGELMGRVDINGFGIGAELRLYDALLSPARECLKIRMPTWQVTSSEISHDADDRVDTVIGTAGVAVSQFGREGLAHGRPKHVSTSGDSRIPGG